MREAGSAGFRTWTLEVNAGDGLNWKEELGLRRRQNIELVQFKLLLVQQFLLQKYLPKTEGERSRRNSGWEKAKRMPTTPGIPRRSPIQVLTRPYVA